MSLSLRDTVKRSPAWPMVMAVRRARAVAQWQCTGKPVPPPHAVKVRNVIQLASRYGASTLVETGTYLGEMIEATKSRFDRIVSVEIHPTLASRAVERFKRDRHVTILVGDSAVLMPGILAQIGPAPALFWLDGHYSGEGTGRAGYQTPIVHEIETIAAHRRGFCDVILIDDARAFGTSTGYPEQTAFINMIDELFAVTPTIIDDAFRIVPR